jgi:hypothetical protein
MAVTLAGKSASFMNMKPFGSQWPNGSHRPVAIIAVWLRACARLTENRLSKAFYIMS